MGCRRQRRPPARAGARSLAVSRRRDTLPHAVTPRETWLVLGAIGRVLRDSTRIDDIHLVADITGRDRFEKLLEAIRARPDGADLLARRPTLGPDDVDLPTLRRLSPDTLGGAFARHLDRHGLELYEGPPSDRYLTDPDARYLVHRYRQMHDIWHVLLGLGTEGHEEVLVHAFTLGHLRLPNSALIVLFGSLKHMVLEGRWHALTHDLWGGYRRGREAGDLLAVRWETRWADPIDEVRRDVGVRAL